MKAVLCPVCNGLGEVRAPTMPCVELITCHGCGGRGWVEVKDDSGYYHYYPCWPYYVPTPPCPWTGPWAATNPISDNT